MGSIEFKKINLKHSHAPSSFSSSTDKTAISPLTAPFEKKDNTKSLDSTAGFLFAATVVLMLSISSSDGTFFLGFSTNDGTDLDDIALATATRVIDVAVPTSSDGYFAVALGESIAGVIGAVFSVVINFLLRPGMMMRPNQDQDEKGAEKYSSRKPFVSQALADGDYFIANGASNSLLVAIGVSPEVAKFCSVFIAAVPSELVKLLPNIQEQRSQEELILQQLLLEQKEKEAAAKKKKSSSILSIFPVVQTKKDEAVTTVNPGDLVPVTGTVEIDFVEVFADVTRWLEYDVLKSEFFGSLEWNNQVVSPSMTGAILGLLAAVSSRMYADLLYGRFKYGPSYKQEEVRSRTSSEWFSLYFTTAASASTLFGFYELSRLPIYRYIQGTLAGGVEGCIGSSSFEACLQTYIDDNAPGASPEAQFRALATNLYMLGQRLQDIAVDTTFDDVAALVRAWSVAFVSYLNHLTASLPSGAFTDFSSTMMLSNQL